MELNEFIFIIRKLDGQEYEMAVVARKETDARRLLNNFLGILASGDQIVSLKGS